jgi:hypothetical protein
MSVARMPTEGIDEIRIRKSSMSPVPYVRRRSCGVDVIALREHCEHVGQDGHRRVVLNVERAAAPGGLSRESKSRTRQTTDRTAAGTSSICQRRMTRTIEPPIVLA